MASKKLRKIARTSPDILVGVIYEGDGKASVLLELSSSGLKLSGTTAKMVSAMLAAAADGLKESGY